jgi:hypothetical protein
MKVMMREIMRFLPGKMTEGMKLLEESLALANKKYGLFPTVRKYTPWIGGGNAINTIIIEVEFDNLTQMAEFFEKTMADPKMMETMPKWETIVESDKEELYMVMP